MKKITITICLLFSTLVPYANNPDLPKEKKSKTTVSNSLYSLSAEKGNSIFPVWGFYIDGSSGLSNILNNNLSSEIWDSKASLGYSLNIGYFHSFGSMFRIKTGLGFSSLSNSLTGNGEFISQSFLDIDNDSYTETLILNNTQKNSNLMYLSVPVIFELGNLSINKTGFYFDFGFKYSYLIHENFNTQGNYTSKGYYEQWGVTVEDVPELGFYSSGELESNVGFKKSNISVLSGFGVTFPLSGVVILKLGIVGSFGLIDIGLNQSEKSDLSPLTEEAYQFRSAYIDNTLAIKKGSKTGYFGFEIGLYINKQVK